MLIYVIPKSAKCFQGLKIGAVNTENNFKAYVSYYIILYCIIKRCCKKTLGS